MKKTNRISTFTIAKIIVLLLSTIFFTFISCSNDDSSGSDNRRQIKVAVVLPASGEQNTRFHRIADWYLTTLKNALEDTKFSTPFTLALEWYDEDSIDLASTAEKLSKRDDLFAIIGPRYSDHVQIFAEQCFLTKKPLIAPCASSESLIRAFAMNAASASASEPFLWTLTESDVSQTEALLAKVSAYGGKKVSFLSSADIYGKTFFEWMPYMATELKLESLQNVRYISASIGSGNEAGTVGTDAIPLESAAVSVLKSGADYVICALSSYKDVAVVLTLREQMGDSAPKLLFTDTAFTADFLKEYGDKAEGVEGTAPYADPSSGFAVMYEAFFGQKAAVGEAHLYDSLLLCGFAAAYCIKNEATTPFSNKAANNAIKSFTGTGKDGKSAWSPLGMAFAFEDINKNNTLNINGATGLLDFDAETLTSALRTVYTHWAVVEGAFVPLDYTSADGSGRTAKNRASWEWQTLIDEAEMEESKSISISYGKSKSRWAVIIAASNGWANYRHQADALYVYHLIKNLKKDPYDDDHIILILADDIATNKRNKKPGEIYARLNGENLYTDDVQIDYLLSELTADDITQIMQGKSISIDKRSENRDSHSFLVEKPTVLETDENADILWFWSGHGANRNGNSELGQFVWQGRGSEGFTTEKMQATLSAMSESKRFRKMLIVAEPCYSASVLHTAKGYTGVLAFTAANGSETSFADIYSVELKVWLSNRFTHNFTDKIAEKKDILYADLYKYLVQNTIGSHVQLFNAEHFGNMYASWPAEFFEKLL